MAQITLLRHGQASFGAANYDQLSPLGQQQAVWLGQHLKDLGQGFERIVCGTMARHQQTALGVIEGLGDDLAIDYHPGLNEYNFRGLLGPLRRDWPEQWTDTGQARRDYYHNLNLAMRLWMDGRIATDGQDSWSDFCARTQLGFEFARRGPAKRTLVVSSGGAIASILASVLELDHARCRAMALQIKNTSRAQLLYSCQRLSLDSFNDVSHLLRADRQQAITFA